MSTSLFYNNNPDVDHDRSEGDLEKLSGNWSESSDTLNEADVEPEVLPIRLSNTRPLVDDRVFPSLASAPQNRMKLQFKVDKRRKTTQLISNDRVIYSYASMYENPSSKAGVFTQLRDKDGRVIATHIIPTSSKPMVKVGDAPPVQRKAWLAQCGILSTSYGKFQHGGRWFKWRCLNDSGRVSVVLRDHSSKSNPTVARFTSIHRLEPGQVMTEVPKPVQRVSSRTLAHAQAKAHRKRKNRSWRASLELNPDYKEVWDYAVFSLIVLECFKGGKTIPPLEYEDESGSNVSYLANLIGLFAGTA